MKRGVHALCLSLVLSSFQLFGISSAFTQPRGHNNASNISVLAKALRFIYLQDGTLGILKRSSGLPIDTSSDDLVQAAMMAARGKRHPDKGMASGILNALLGVYCQNRNSERAICLMKAYDQNEELQPDLVAFCLAYVATEESYPDQAAEFLERATNLYSTNHGGEMPEHRGANWINLKKSYGICLLQEEEEFAVVSKPSGMVCYHGKNTPRKDRNDMSLEECLIQNGMALSALNREGRGMVHRIDRGTSGCLVLAKTNQMHARLLSQFFLKSLKKSYQALVYDRDGKLQTENLIELEIDGRPARSCISIEATVSPKIHRVRVQTAQGRRHQVRKHLSKGLQAPILLDPLYGGEEVMAKIHLPLWKNHRRRRQFCLHADFLELPDFGIKVRAPLPSWWNQLEDQLSQL